MRSLMMLLIVTIWAASAVAKPAPWYLWQSKLNGHLLCIQTTPGKGWQRLSGPYTSAQCHRYLKLLLIDPGVLTR